MARPINNDYVHLVIKSALGIIFQAFSKCYYTQFGFRLAANPSLKIAGLITALPAAYDWLFLFQNLALQANNLMCCNQNLDILNV